MKLWTSEQYAENCYHAIYNVFLLPFFSPPSIFCHRNISIYFVVVVVVAVGCWLLVVVGVVVVVAVVIIKIICVIVVVFFRALFLASQAS